MDTREKLSVAIGNLFLNHPFYGSFLGMTNIVENNRMPTMATDGKNIYYNKEFADSLSLEETKGVLFHEVLHIVFYHTDKKRVGSRKHVLWNYAADFATNLMIPYKLPKDCLLDKKYDGLVVEQIYRDLEKEIEKNKGEGEEQKSFDEHIISDLSEEEKEDVKDKIMASAELAKQQGKLPGEIEELIKSLNKNKVNWRKIFRRLTQDILTKNDFSWSRPNRKYLNHNIYLPSLHGYELSEVAVAIDTSGSVSIDELQQFLSEIDAMKHIVSKVKVVTCDTQVNGDFTVGKLDSVLKKIKIKGRGGTDFRPVFENLRKKHPKLLIFFTDTYGSFPDKAPPYPVLWIVTDKSGRVPFGKIVYFE